ncbi:hypothetical protein [Protofrankia symbiont of Coriaria ruscifolia]|uniref:hypothetical protein n=1 Tax=Protofrankia symbiont of Coriaria ruscifolia TaxID=1306542 RepID=UPI001F5EB61B|nr:hypothetical protein [Protofrankia symbiont of Coriaria ruscifolia]
MPQEHRESSQQRSVFPGSTVDSGQPSRTDCCAARQRNTPPAARRRSASLSPTAESSRSTLTKSANCSVSTSASSWAVRAVSRVVPMRTLAAFTMASRCLARYCVVVSRAAVDTLRTMPPGSFNG